MEHTESKTRSPGGARRVLRLGLLIAVVAVGTGALSLSLSVAARLDRLVSTAIDGGGLRVVIANANLRADESFDWQMPPAFTPTDKQTLIDAGAGVLNVAITNNLPWRQIEVAGAAYRPGTVLGSDEQYAEVMGLEYLAGAFFSATDVSGRARVAVLSERAAIALYGDVQSALGQTFRGDRNIFGTRRLSGGTASRVESGYDAYTVVGVFKDVTSFERDAFNVPDYIVPYTVMFPADMPIMPFVRTFVARTENRPLEGIAAGLRASLSQIKDDDELKLSVWEGAVDRGGASSVDRVRDTLKSLSLVAQLFGLAILAVASFGIVSGMMAEAAERKRELAIKRALGRTAFQAALELCSGGIRLAAAGAAIGFIGAQIAGGFSTDALTPFLDALGVSGADVGAASFEFRTLAAPLAAVLLAGLFSLLPALKSASEPIVEGLKE